MNRRQNWSAYNATDEDFYTPEQKSFLNKRGLMSDTIDYLNSLVKIDKDAMRALFQPVFCNAELANTPLIQAGKLGGDVVAGDSYPQYWTSMMGIINGLLCCDEKTGYICRIPRTMEFMIVEPQDCKGHPNG